MWSLQIFTDVVPHSRHQIEQWQMFRWKREDLRGYVKFAALLPASELLESACFHFLSDRHSVKTDIICGC